MSVIKLDLNMSKAEHTITVAVCIWVELLRARFFVCNSFIFAYLNIYIISEKRILIQNLS